MAKIIIKKRNGDVRCTLDSFAKLCTVKSAEQKRELLGEDTVTVKTESATPMELSVGDYIEIYGSKYTLNKINEPTKTGERNFENSMVFEGLQYKLLDAQFRNADAAGKNPTADFSIVADVKLLMQLLITNVNRVAKSLGEQWELGDCPETEYTDYTFSNQNCLSVLQSTCSDNDLEFEIEAVDSTHFKLHIRKIGKLFPASFTFGKGGSIYKLTRKNVSSNDIITRLYIEGGTRNITSKYRDGATRLRIGDNEESYVENATAIAAFGVKEGSKTYDDIYPHRTGKVTAIVEGNPLQFVDEEMFDLNEKDENGNTKYLIDSTTAKLKFTKGNLAGYQFEISKFDSTTKTFTINQYEDSRGLKIPMAGSAYTIEKDAEYVLLDIVMPDDPYVVDAEAELLEAGKADLEEDSQPKVEYELELSSLELKRKFGSEVGTVNLFDIGDYLPIKDPDINVDKAIRIKAFTRDCYSDEYKYKLTLGDTVEVSLIERLIEDNEEFGKIIEINNLADLAKARMNWRTTQELLGMVFDGDGYFDASNIRPSSIETLMLSVGNRAGQFSLLNVIIEANAAVSDKPNANYVKISSGTLIHYAIEETDRTWSMSSRSFTLTSNAAMYVYARCLKNGKTGDFVISTERFATDTGSYYYFQIGILSSVYNGYRELTTTYGATRITGRCINCGKIESIDKNTYFDLDNGEIGGKIKFVNSNGELVNITDLEQQLNNTGTSLGELSDLVDSLQEQVDGTIEYWFGTEEPTLTNEPASQWTDDDTKATHMGDIYTNTTTGLEYRFSRQGSSSTVNGELVRKWTYYWQEVPSSGIGQAIKTANEALGLAGTKSHTWVTASYSTHPDGEYKKGDLWITLNDFKIRIAINDRGTAWAAADWKEAGYSDDTKANEALSALQALADDSIITPTEKIMLKDEMENLKVDYSTVKAQAQLAGISTTAFDAAYSTLLVYTSSILADMTVNTTVDKATYNTNFAAYYTERTKLLDAISKGYVDSVVAGGNNYIANGAYFSSLSGWALSIDPTEYPVTDEEGNNTYDDDGNLITQKQKGVLALANDTVMGKVLRVTKPNAVSWWYFGTGMEANKGNIMLPNGKFNNGITYTVAFWVKCSKAAKLRVGICDGTSANIVAALKDFDVTTKWQRISYTFTANNLSSKNSRLYITTANDVYFSYCWFTKFVLVEGTKAPEWSSSDQEVQAAITANADLLKAINSNYTQIEGGLILSTFLKLGALIEGEDEDATWVESAGLKAMYESKDEIAAYFGGTYEEALAGTKTGMTIIYHNGKLKAQNADITGVINATSGVFKNVLIQGSTRNKFTLVEGSLTTNYNDNIAMYSADEGWSTLFSLPWDKEQIGRRIVVANFYWNGSISRGNTSISAPSGKYFFIDGIRKSTLNINRQVVELMGFGTGDNFYGWIVLNAIDAYTDRAYGSCFKCIATGMVTGSSTGATIDAMSFDNNQLTVTRVSKGRYKVTIPSSWFAEDGDYMVWLQGTGWIDGANTKSSTAWIKATLISKTKTYFEVGTSDDDSSNDGSFVFMINNLREWNNWG